ncbi:sugar transferase [Bacillus pseudomycoides]|uniref:Sugar transferase n=1 Tax=Bacillus pseudomycoides TaxID=64104 RepID=A0AA91VAU1_9BACI|nr:MULTISPECIES: sugar transferase [Bacillus]PEB56282.1 sugar transferase [Bacillus sp. AFS098217]PED81712.1 sugar transferase [Bacillus pseudomycoides]PEU09361.1 sugar transferase [Bacillus sp. AFS014408]PEU10640.1 sugar transferase [Bacillus sp. AFS019443]PFW64255.1 sugar transferase [Bacillus sp. AFS075034]
MKRLFDLLITTVLFLMALPVTVLVTILVRIKFGSPVIFKQQRPGLKGKPFYIYKFRTMTNETDDNGILLPEEKRFTSFGKALRKTSLDEIPQLINVIKGDISLVGPRPLLMEYLPLYTQKQAKRHDVKPGITGWAQINGRNTISWEEKFNLDVWYVENQSFWLDIKILWFTFWKVIKRNDVNQSDNVTMEKFAGSAEK